MISPEAAKQAVCRAQLTPLRVFRNDLDRPGRGLGEFSHDLFGPVGATIETDDDF
jgi:hypothetical protein